MSDINANIDIRAEQSLVLFKNWLAKHRFIKYTGDKDSLDDLLMLFLRIRKFSMQKTFESFEFTIPFIKSHPHWYGNAGPTDYEFTDKPNSPLIFMKNLDAEGRKVYIYKMKNFKNFDNVEFPRRYFMTPLLFLTHIDAQLNGVVIILDFSGVNLGKLIKVPVQQIYDAFRASKYGLMRLKQLNIIGMPSYFKPIYEIGKSFTTAKILERFNFINDVKELSQHMDVSVLPKEYGGLSNELLDCAELGSGVAFLKKLHDFDVDFSKVQVYENVGSFRKLEID